MDGVISECRRIFLRTSLNRKRRLDLEPLRRPETRTLKYHEYKAVIPIAKRYILIKINQSGVILIKRPYYKITFKSYQNL